MSKGNTKAQNMTGTISTESILITVESNWIQMRSRVKRERDRQDVRDRRGPKAEVFGTSTPDIRPSDRLTPSAFSLKGAWAGWVSQVSSYT
jgi:hypothetical protein